LARRVDLASGRFALIEDGHRFSLVPWRPILEPYVGHEVEGLVRRENVSWTIGKTKSLEI